MDVITLEAQAREVGTKAARAVRRTGNVPCNLYGHHVDPVAFQVPELSLRPLIFTHENHLVEVNLNGESWECVMKQVDFHPVTDQPIHAEFQVLQAGEKVTRTVPLQFHGTPAGKKDGGVTRQVVHEVEISCLPKDIPGHIDIDISALMVGEAIHVGDLDVPGLEFLTPAEQTIVSVAMPRVSAVAAEEEEGLLEEAAEEEEEV